MRLTRPTTVLLGVLLVAMSSAAQTSSDTKDPQAVLVFTSCLNAAGGIQSLAAIQDFTGRGNITYYWAGQQVQGSVIFRGRGSDQFHLDASLPSGTRSWAVGSRSGSLKEVDGTLHKIPLQNALNLGGLSLPYLGIATALSDTSAAISYVGLVEFGGRKVYQVRVRRTFGLHVTDPAYFSTLPSKDYFIDAVTFLVLKTEDMSRSLDPPVQEYPHDVLFSDYRQVGGVVVPFSIAEEVNGQKTWTVQLDSVTFNAGLTDADFQFR